MIAILQRAAPAQSVLIVTELISKEALMDIPI